uniref:Uncharacterized protein n=1 Tax=Poecilia latipinna TaxID=48699 RepID=A0A3B3U9K7_9TELE
QTGAQSLPHHVKVSLTIALFSFGSEQEERFMLTTLMAARSEQHLEVMFAVLPAFKLSKQIYYWCCNSNVSHFNSSIKC